MKRAVQTYLRASAPCEREIAKKDHRRVEMAPKLAHFPLFKDMASFDFEAQPSLDPKQVRDLGQGSGRCCDTA